MSISKKSVIPVFTSTYAGLKNVANFAYGIGAASYSVHSYFTEFWADYGIANTIIHTLPPVSMIISGIGALDALVNIHSNFKNGCGFGDSRNVVNVLKLAASGTLFTAAYTHSSEFITFGAASTALAYLSGGMAFFSLTKLIRDIQRYQAANKYFDDYLKVKNINLETLDYIKLEPEQRKEIDSHFAKCNKAWSDMMLSIMNSIGWTSFFLAHLPAFATAAPVFLGMSAAFLIAGGLYAGYTARQHMNADRRDYDPDCLVPERAGLHGLFNRASVLEKRITDTITGHKIGAPVV